MSDPIQRDPSDAKEMAASSEIEEATSSQPPTVLPAQNEELPASYYRGKLFLGTYFAVAVSLASGVATYGLAAPLLARINQDIGPSPDIDWVGYVYNLVLACALCLVGRLSDIFGRRWFFICGNFLAIVGTIIAATAINVPMLIVGMAIASLGSTTQLSFQYVMGELVPIGKRFLVMSTLFVWTMPLGGIGPIISVNFQDHTALRWRWCFWLCAALNIVSTLLYYFFYHPPSFRRLEANKTKMQALKEMDWVGVFLFSSGFFLFLVGLNWGGKRYPWNSAAVISAVVIGAVELIAFVTWEIKATLKTPFIPVRLFKNGPWVAMMLCLGVGALQYYAMALLWPRMIVALWPDVATGNNFGWMAVITGLTLQVGQSGGGLLANFVKQKPLLIGSTIVGTALLAATACAKTDNMVTVLVLLILSFLGIGIQEAVSGVFCTVSLKDQADIGVGGGTAATIRAGLSALGSVIYSSVLNARLGQTIPRLVPPSAAGSGLPESSIPSLVKFLQGAGSQNDVEGLTPQILAEATSAYQKASSLAYRDVMLTTLAFGAISILCAFFTPAVDKKTANVVSRVLEKDGKNSKGVDEKESV